VKFDTCKTDLTDVAFDVKGDGLGFLAWVCLVWDENQRRTLSWGNVVFLKDSVA
jgi:hypothetical protein